MSRVVTTVRLPIEILKGLKARALEEGKSLNSLFLEIARDALRSSKPSRRIPKDDPIWQIGRDPFDSGLGDLAENHDEYLYGKYSKFAR